MTKRVYEIETPDDLGPMWMNKDNLLLCLTAYCPNTQFKVRDVTDERKSARDDLAQLRSDSDWAKGKRP